MHELIVKTAFFFTVWRCYLARGRGGAKYCDERVCLYVCSLAYLMPQHQFSVLVTCGESRTFRPADVSVRTFRLRTFRPGTFRPAGVSAYM